MKENLKVYKYRTLSNRDSMLRVADILKNQRIFCSELKHLNDPFEGILNYRFKDEEDRMDRIMKDLWTMRVASFSLRRNIPLMWFHYSDGGKGCCVELTLKQVQVDPVQYTISNVENTRSFTDECLKRELLLHKFVDWSYEEEVRYITPRDQFLECTVTQLFVGDGCNKHRRRYLYKLCNSLGIPVFDFRFLPRNGDLSECVSSKMGFC